ncbi:hypothetical protein BU26DRAFT_502603 [Trematosphaeria pertusa]|uniref:Uncharacterized protein n=1 Tax=Trematosphaeria pertusa TaxID=390896 RepID=A0A6A6INC5_9PLEO|nr:uncharacterized protein BU26DRAFT_502603 [Trematosphaeria pertusa]KAF2252055.1 hypothetical protein BU26DRAFT_502603 [Trematosphaeria pertusa]
MNGMKVQLLRRHDYYKGWLDCVKASEDEELLRRGLITEEEAPHLRDMGDLRGLKNGGANVGAHFGWSVMCKVHQRRERDVRLDDQERAAADITPRAGFEERPFWRHVKNGIEQASVKFHEQLGEANAKEEARS